MATTYLQSHDVVREPAAAAPAAPAAAAAAPSSLTAEQIAIVKATVPVLQQHGVAITTLFYNNMLAAHPELKNVFSATSQATGAQPRALATSVLLYATYIDDLGKLKHVVERIAHKHASLQIQPAQYDIVGKFLMQAIGIVLGDAATPAIVDAWTAAYAVLASVFIGREQSLYTDAATRDAGHGWVGWRPFRIARRENANPAGSILNLYLAPADGRPLPSYEPGQYVSLQLLVPALGVHQSRQYSLSALPAADGGLYRVSIRRDIGTGGNKPGLLSNMLHDQLHEGDQVELSQPQGEFVLTTASDAPVVLLSAGVGATPMLPMLERLAGQDGQAGNRPVAWVHASHALAELPFVHQVRQLQASHPDRIQTYWTLTQTTTALPAPTTAGDVWVTGQHLRLSDFSEAERARFLFTDNPQAEYYICGPSSFMVESWKTLESLGVGAARVHVELFATGDLHLD